MYFQSADEFVDAKVSEYDGQTIYIDGMPAYELGSYLGGGASGVVYEAIQVSNQHHVAVKILHPVGYKVTRSVGLNRFRVVHEEKSKWSGHGPMTVDHVRWISNPSTNQIIPTYEDPKTKSLRELPLPRCIEVWGKETTIKSIIGKTNSPSIKNTAMTMMMTTTTTTTSSSTNTKPDQSSTTSNEHKKNPSEDLIPEKFITFLKERRVIYREIQSMMKVSSPSNETHKNVLLLERVLELVQDSKCTIFLIVELANGGELFDRIRIDEGCSEDIARNYLIQLLNGVAHCHHLGVCHRDLKPENLLLSDTEAGESVLKIADFGLSAFFRDKDVVDSAYQRMMSVVGSPHYVAPEVLKNHLHGSGYDGAKADMWSVGVILYAMLAGSLPFGKDLLVCPRFIELSKWMMKQKNSLEANNYKKNKKNTDHSTTATNANAATKTDSPSQHRVVGGSPDLLPHISSSSPLEQQHLLRGGGRVGGGEEGGISKPKFSKTGGGEEEGGGGVISSPKTSSNKTSKVLKSSISGFNNLQEVAWFFPPMLSDLVRDLLLGLLNPDPLMRFDVVQAKRHEWIKNSPNASTTEEEEEESNDDHIVGTVELEANNNKNEFEQDKAIRDMEMIVSNVEDWTRGFQEDDKISRFPIMDEEDEALFLPSSSHAIIANQMSMMDDIDHCCRREQDTDDEDDDDPRNILPRRAVVRNTNNIVSSSSLSSTKNVPVPTSSTSNTSTTTNVRDNNSSSSRRRKNSAPKNGELPSSSSSSNPSGSFKSPPLAPARHVLAAHMTSLLPPLDGPDQFISRPASTRRSIEGRSRRTRSLSPENLHSSSSEFNNSSSSMNISSNTATPSSSFSRNAFVEDDEDILAARMTTAAATFVTTTSRFHQGKEQGDNLSSLSSSLKNVNTTNAPVDVFNSLVKRSTRFVTSVPAKEVLNLIADMINHTQSRLGSSARQIAVVDYDTFRLDINRGDAHFCSVRVYLLPRDESVLASAHALYLLEFVRGVSVDIFTFKEFYMLIREHLNDIVKSDSIFSL